jgi:hypothetical protein
MKITRKLAFMQLKYGCIDEEGYGWMVVWLNGYMAEWLWGD